MDWLTRLEAPQIGARVINLMDALRRSVGGKEEGARKSGASSPRKASSRRKAPRRAKSARSRRRKAA